MKIIYSALFLAFSFTLSAQDTAVFQPLETDDIAGFKLYPNPVFDDVVYITTQNNAPKTVVIYDVFGGVLLQDRMLGNSLSISHLTPGVYVLQVTEEKKTMTRKLVVK
ncbi:MAG: T9SS type A sorting domain-containing protein [Aurantibacter sp.]